MRKFVHKRAEAQDPSYLLKPNDPMVQRQTEDEMIRLAMITIAGLNKVFTSINASSGLSFNEIKVVEYIASMNSSYPWVAPSDDQLIADSKYYDRIVAWNSARRSFSERQGHPLEYDHVMILTGYTLASFEATGKVLGLAAVGKICGDSSVSLIGGLAQRTWLSAAHEIGHSFGAQHDAATLGDSECDPADQKYIMAPSIERETAAEMATVLQFSRCSLDAFRQKFIDIERTKGHLCLAKPYSSNPNASHTAMRKALPSITNWENYLRHSRYSLDETCQLAFPESDGFFREEESILRSPGLICLQMPCKTPGGYLRQPGVRAPPYTPCGDRKSCDWQGRCVSDAMAPTADEICFFGDAGGKACEIVAINMKWVPSVRIRLCTVDKEFPLKCCDTYAKMCRATTTPETAITQRTAMKQMVSNVLAVIKTGSGH